MYRLDVQPAAGELAFHETWEAAPAVTLAVTGVRVDQFETAGGAVRTRLALAVEAANGSGEPFEFVNDFGLLDGAGEFRRHVWVDPARRPQALPGVRLLVPGEAVRGEVYVPVDPGDGEAMYTPAFGGLAEHGCQGCDRDHHVFLARAMWQPVVVQRAAIASAPGS